MNNQMLDILTGQLFPAREARRNEWRWLLLGVGLGDALCVAGGFILAYLLRFFTDWPIFYPGDGRIDFYTTLIILLVPSWVALFNMYGLYNPQTIFGGTTEYARIFNACTVGLLVIIVLTFLQPDFVIARGWLLLAWASVSAMAIGWRFIVRRMVYSLRERGHLIQRSVVLGANAEGQAVARQLNASRKAGVQVIGFVDDHLAPGTEVLPGVPVLGPVTAFEAIITHTGVDGAIIADTEMVRERLPAVCGAMEALRRLDVSLAPGIFELLTVGLEVRERGSVPLLGLNKTRITGLHAVGKAIIDRVGALVALILLSPLLALVAVLVRLDSPGPIIYRRRVVGVGNQTFDAFKFRTMQVDGDKLLTPELRKELNEAGKLQNDPRITRLGRFLRRTSIDELPQLVNVLLGQMSLVGPRMITTDELRHFGRWRYNLVTVRPGLTGLWQISGRSNLGYEERVRLDMHYIRNYSIWLDLYIIYRTIAVVISGRGAY